MLAFLGLVGVVAAFGGSLLLVWRGYRSATGKPSDVVGPARLLLAGAIVAIMIKDLVRTETPDTVVVYLFVFQTAIMLIPAALVWRTPTWQEFGWLALLGLIGVWLQRTFNRGMQAADATVALPFNFTRLIWSAAFGWILFSYLPDLWTWIGGTIIFAASIYIARRT